MSTWYDGLPAAARLDDLVRRVDGDDNIVGVLATGSWAHGMATEFSDVDLVLVVERNLDHSTWRHLEDRYDVSVLPVARLRDIPRDPGRWWDRYRFARATVLLDRADGAVQRLVDAWRTLTPAEVTDAVDLYLDAYLTYANQSLKSAREDRPGPARLDAAESIPWALTLMFAVHGRVRPANKYLEWELEHEPFDTPGWDAAHVLDLVNRVLDDGSPQAQQEIFALIEPAVRRLGFGGVLDGFGPGLALLRGDA